MNFNQLRIISPKDFDIYPIEEVGSFNNESKYFPLLT